MKVLHLITWLNRGGIEMWLLSMLREISRNDCQMDICCKGANLGELANEAKEKGVQVIHCPLKFNQIAFLHRLEEILRNGKYDILHNHLGVSSGLPVLAAHRVGIPAITSFHNTKHRPQTWTNSLFFRQIHRIYGKVNIAYALRKSDFVTGCSKAVINSLDPKRRILDGKAGVIYYGSDLPELASVEPRISFRRELGWGKDTPVIIHVGRFVEQKNHRAVLRIFKLVLRRVPSAKLILVGDGPLRSVIERNVTEGLLQNSVRVLGLRDDVPHLMTLCDVLLFPSLFEGFGLVAVEANAAALPVVGTRTSGIKEAVLDGTTALLHEVNDIEGMAQSVIKIFEEPQLAERLGRNGRLRVQQKFSVKVSADRLLKLYNGFITPL